ncbi:hypothetical protein ACFV4I_17435 [Nocardiopsis alba]|uniref:hypothetical protein n=1 Tax=Nocardiopsis alba TaxID=53437 RepID=UPI00364A43B7
MFVMSLLGTALTAALLISLVPSFFGPGDQGNVWAAGDLAGLTLSLAVTTLRLRPSASNSHSE